MKKQAQLGSQIKKLQYQLSYSEHINKQLSQQLQSMCEKAGVSVRKGRSAQNVNMINTQNHLQELYYVEPLLMAYQNKLNLLEEQLKQLGEDSHALLKFGEEIINQNKFLRKELENKNQYILKSEQIGLNANFMKLDNQNLNQKNEILNQKNEFLIQKLREAQQQIEKIKINQIKPNQNLNDSMKELRAEREKLKNCELTIIDLQKRLEVAINQLGNQKSMVRDQERRTNQLQNQVVRLKNQLKIGRQQSQSYQVSHEGIVNNLELEVQTLKTQLLAIQRRESQLFSKGMAVEADLQDKNSKCHNLSLQNTQLQTNNNNILQMLETYEVKVNTQNKRIKQLEVDLRETNEASISSRKQGEMLEWKLSQKEKETERKEGEWKKERERTAKMWEDRFQAMKKALNEQQLGIFQQIQNIKRQKPTKL